MLRESSLWDQYKVHIALSCSAILLQSIFVVGLLMQTRRRRIAEAEVEQQRLQLTHLTRVGVLGELSGSIAHELTQPLTAIQSNAQAARLMLDRGSADLSEIREILDDIVDDNNRAGEVIGHLRGLMKKSDVSFQRLDLNRVIKEVVELLHSDFIERSVAVNMTLLPNLPLVRGDPVQLQQLFLNLVMNACDAMSASDQSRRFLSLSTKRGENGEVQVSVMDRGRGIAPGEIPRVFEPFFTTKEHGLGLGLPICRTIVAAHDGRFEVSNNLGGGATFSVTFPGWTGG